MLKGEILLNTAWVRMMSVALSVSYWVRHDWLNKLLTVQDREDRWVFTTGLSRHCFLS